MRLCGTVNCSRPSRKNGRFSGKNSACRGSITNFPASDSTSAKSGRTVPLSVRLLVTPQRTLPPNCGVACAYFQPEDPGAPFDFCVTNGLTSNTNPRSNPVNPSRLPDCPRKLAFARLAGTHESSKPECCT